MKISTCKSCDGRVIWTETIAGGKMPVDAEPVDLGNVLLEERDGQMPLARVVPPSELVGKPRRYVSHFATCRDARSWRKTR